MPSRLQFFQTRCRTDLNGVLTHLKAHVLYVHQYLVL